jgi:hypothetical protein
MHILHPALAAGLVSLSLISSPALADPAKDTAMLKLAASSGCTVCHSVDPPQRPMAACRSARPGVTSRHATSV